MSEAKTTKVTLDEYNTRLKEIDETAKAEKVKALKEFCLSNNRFNIGDIITDDNITIIIQSWGFNYGYHTAPYMTYKGRQLKKDGTEMKKPIQAAIVDNRNIRKLN